MYLYRTSLSERLIKAAKSLFTLLILAGLLLGAVLFSMSTDANTLEQQRASTEEAIRRAAVSCYSIEGVYPQQIDYLEEHYGLSIDTDKFSVEYQAIGDNILPTVIVGIRGEDAF